MSGNDPVGKNMDEKRKIYDAVMEANKDYEPLHIEKAFGESPIIRGSSSVVPTELKNRMVGVTAELIEAPDDGANIEWGPDTPNISGQVANLEYRITELQQYWLGRCQELTEKLNSCSDDWNRVNKKLNDSVNLLKSENDLLRNECNRLEKQVFEQAQYALLHGGKKEQETIIKELQEKNDIFESRNLKLVNENKKQTAELVRLSSMQNSTNNLWLCETEKGNRLREKVRELEKENTAYVNVNESMASQIRSLKHELEMSKGHSQQDAETTSPPSREEKDDGIRWIGGGVAGQDIEPDYYLLPLGTVIKRLGKWAEYLIIEIEKR